MLTAISRYGARVLPETEDIVAGCKARGEFIQGPQIAEFEAAFARRAGMELALWPTLLRIEKAACRLPAFTDALPEKQPDAE